MRREQFLRAREQTNGRMGRSRPAMGSCTPCIKRCCTSGSRPDGGYVCIGRLASGKRRGYGERRREIAAELAVHFERGRDYRRAIQYLQQAGENASAALAHVEAIALLSKGLELLKILPDTPERTQQELALQIALGAPLMATKGFAAPEVEKAYARARELCQLTGETPHLFPILRGLCEFYELRAEYQTAQELGEQLLALAQRQPDPALLLVAHQVLGDTLLCLGEFAGPRTSRAGIASL